MESAARANQIPLPIVAVFQFMPLFEEVQTTPYKVLAKTYVAFHDVKIFQLLVDGALEAVQVVPPSEEY